MEHNLLFEKFQARGTFQKSLPYGSGHINDTYHIITEEDFEADYILQRINHHIFKNIPKLQENIFRVTNHLRWKLEQIPGSDPDRQTLTLLLSQDDLPYYQDPGGDYWRLYVFIRDNKSYDRVRTPSQAFEGGLAFGRFQRLISDLDGPPLFNTIPDFHNMSKRLESFNAILKSAPSGRVNLAGEEIQFVMDRSEIMKKIQLLGMKGQIPERITHNDTKFNNVLLDLEDKGLCVIDLDTVMPGYIHYDFGDAIRTSTNTAEEDEADLNKVDMDLQLFENFSRGFLTETAAILNPVEIDNLAFSGKMMTFIIGLRFLTDYLDGDHYFKTKHEDHNLQRTKAQFKLVSSMEKQYEKMQACIYGIVEELTRHG